MARLASNRMDLLPPLDLDRFSATGPPLRLLPLDPDGFATTGAIRIGAALPCQLNLAEAMWREGGRSICWGRPKSILPKLEGEAMVDELW
jgi:hypothetical protein